MVLDPSGEVLVVRAARGVEVGSRVPVGPSISWQAMERREPIVLNGRAGAEYATTYTKDVAFSVCVPLVFGPKTLGVLNLNRAGGHPGEDALAFARTVAGLVAFAVERFELYEDLQHFTGQLLLQEEEHRRRLARDLHDGLAPILVSAYGQLQSASDPETVERATVLLRKAIQETRTIIGSVRPATLDDLGLAGALAGEARQLADDAGWQMTTELDDPGPLSREAESTLYRVAIEALQNAKAHAAAHAVRLTLRKTDRELEIEIADDGHGFQTEQWGEAGVRPGHFGLLGMRERISLLGGECRVHSRPGEGTTVRITVPRERLR
jgi:signal transduction histidine kinase